MARLVPDAGAWALTGMVGFAGRSDRLPTATLLIPLVNTSRATQIVTLTSSDALERVSAEQWDGLVEALPRPCPYLLHGWLTAHFRHGLDGAKPQLHLAWRDGRLVGVFPLETSSQRGLRISRFAGGALGTWRDLMLASGETEETARQLVEAATRSGQDLCQFQCLAPGSRISEFAEVKLVKRFDNAWFDLTGGWEAAYKDKIARRHRQDYRRKRRLLSELGRLETGVARKAEELEAVLGHTFRLHELRWKGRYDSSGYACADSRRAMVDAIGDLASRDAYRIVTLELDGNPIAFLSYFIIGRTAVGHRTAFDPTYLQFSPGALVFFDGFMACEADGLARFEFGVGDDRYKRSLADVIEPLYDGIGLAMNVRGTLAAAGLRQYLKLAQRVRSSSRMRAAFRGARDLVHAAT